MSIGRILHRKGDKHERDRLLKEGTVDTVQDYVQPRSLD